MAKNGNEKDMSTGRPPRDDQMRSLQKAQGTPVRQSELPPYVSRSEMPGEKD
jgi:hypothetical protein